jgi:hypothetical protein
MKTASGDSRTDDIIGRRPPASTGGMEESSPASGCRRMRGPRRQGCDQGRGAGFLVLKAGAARKPAEIERRSWRWCAKSSGRSRLSLAITVGRLPKTSGRFARNHQEDRRWRRLTMPATIEDPKVLDETATR